MGAAGGGKVTEAAAAPPLLRLEGLSRRFGGLLAVAPVDLAVERGDVCAILGPSGCGKSTLLRMISGFVAPSAGRIEIDGRDVTALGPERRPTNLVFQSYGLFPHMTVAENVGFGLSIARRPRAEIAARVEEALALVRLDGFGPRPVDRLSGGQQQRVALARALILRPLVLLLDEPLAALDLKLRETMQDELRRIHREIGGTFLFVTHDQGEAFNLANRIVVMNAGKVEQAGSPDEIYRRPRSRFVARFVGEANMLEGTRRDGRVTLAVGAEFDAPGPDGPLVALVRPEALSLGESSSGPSVTAEIIDIVYLGPQTRLRLRTAAGETMTFRDAAPDAPTRRRRGEVLRIGWSASDHWLIDGAEA